MVYGYHLSPQMNVFKTGNFQWTDQSDEFTRQWPWLGINGKHQTMFGCQHVNNSQESGDSSVIVEDEF